MEATRKTLLTGIAVRVASPPVLALVNPLLFKITMFFAIIAFLLTRNSLIVLIVGVLFFGVSLIMTARDPDWPATKISRWRVAQSMKARTVYRA